MVKKKVICCLCLLVVIFQVYSKVNEKSYQNFLTIWPNLEIVDVDYDKVILIDPTIVINRGEDNDDLLMAFHFSSDGTVYLIKKGYGPLPPFDYVYITTRQNPDQTLISGKFICVLNSGILYVKKPIGNNGMIGVTVLEKYINNENGFSRINQPFSYIGSTCKANTTFPIYLEPQKSSVVANISQGSQVQVLGIYKIANAFDGWYLIKSVTGLVGWHKAEYLNTDNHMYSYYSISLLDGMYP